MTIGVLFSDVMGENVVNNIFIKIILLSLMLCCLYD